MELKIIKISDLKLADYNPRKITEDSFSRLRASIRDFGFSDPVIVNSYPGRENVIIGGHMRVRAAQAEEMTEVPCFMVNLDEAKEKMLNIALNNHLLQGEWDEQKLTEILVKLNEDGVNIRMTGMDDKTTTSLLDHGMLKLPAEDALISQNTENSDKLIKNKKCPYCGR